MSDFAMSFLSDVAANGVWVAVYFLAIFAIKKRKSIQLSGSQNVSKLSTLTSIADIANTPNPAYMRTGRPLPNTPTTPFSLATLGHFYEEVRYAPRKRQWNSGSQVTRSSKTVEDKSNVHRRLTYPLAETPEDYRRYQNICPIAGDMFMPTSVSSPASSETQQQKASLEEGRYGLFRPRQVTGCPDTYYSPPLLPVQTSPGERPYGQSRPRRVNGPISFQLPQPPPPPPSPKASFVKALEEGRLYELSTHRAKHHARELTVIEMDISDV